MLYMTGFMYAVAAHPSLELPVLDGDGGSA